MWKNSQDGTPVLQHAAFADPEDPKLWDCERDFLFGDHLFVSPVVQPKLQRQLVYLPKGNWYYFWTGQPFNGEIFVNVMPEQIPFFVREGAVLPTYPVRQHTGEQTLDELTLYIYYKKGEETSQLFEDEGDGYDYAEGAYCHRNWDTKGTDKSFSITQHIQGDWKVPYEKIKLFLVGFPTYVRKCKVDKTEMPIKEIRLRDRALYTVTVAPDFKRITWNA